jgi:uncharacterized membrane protein YeaQ/YmgE (transglycosylase-associated protein family)
VSVLFALLVICVLLFVVLPFIGATLMSAVWALLVGLFLGLIARGIAPGHGRIGLLTTALVGVLGGLIGRVIARGVHAGGFGQFLLEVLASAVLVMVARGASSGAKA